MGATIWHVQQAGQIISWHKNVYSQFANSSQWMVRRVEGWSSSVLQILVLEYFWQSFQLRTRYINTRKWYLKRCRLRWFDMTFSSLATTCHVKRGIRLKMFRKPGRPVIKQGHRRPIFLLPRPSWDWSSSHTSRILSPLNCLSYCPFKILFILILVCEFVFHFEPVSVELSSISDFSLLEMSIKSLFCCLNCCSISMISDANSWCSICLCLLCSENAFCSSLGSGSDFNNTSLSKPMKPMGQSERLQKYKIELHGWSLPLT